MEEFKLWFESLVDKESLTNETIAILAWNQALKIACEDFGYQEGTDYGVEKRYSINI